MNVVSLETYKSAESVYQGVRQTSINCYGVIRVHRGEMFTIGGAWRASRGEERVPVGLARAHGGRQRGRACTHATKNPHMSVKP